MVVQVQTAVVPVVLVQMVVLEQTGLLLLFQQMEHLIVFQVHQ
jgi:hypothetical protein